MKRLTIERTMVIVTFVLLLAMATRVPVDTDTWWHIRSGEYTLTEGMIYHDPFSHTMAGEPWINHSWGAQLVLYGLWQLAGDVGLSLYTALLAVGGMAVLYRISAGNPYLRAFVMILGAATAAVFWSARPQMMSFFLSTVVLYVLYLYKHEGKDRLWGLLPLLWLWANLHAGWTIAYLFILAFVVGEALNRIFGLHEDSLPWRGWRKLLLVTALSVPLLAVSPYGLENLLVPFNTVSIGALRQFIQEWNSPNFQGRETWPFIATVALLFGALWGSRRQFDWSGFFLLGGTLFLALLYGRNIAVFAVAATPILTHHLDNLLTERGWVLRPRRRISPLIAAVNWLLLSVIVLGAGAYLVGVLLPTTREPLQAQVLPVDAVNYMNEHDLPRELFNSYNWGGYVLFAAPEYPVFVDGRTDLYGEFVRTALQVSTARGDWQAVLAEQNVNLVLTETGGALDGVLRDAGGWALLYEDDLAVIFVREGTYEDE